MWAMTAALKARLISSYHSLWCLLGRRRGENESKPFGGNFCKKQRPSTAFIWPAETCPAQFRGRKVRAGDDGCCCGVSSSKRWGLALRLMLSVSILISVMAKVWTFGTQVDDDAVVNSITGLVFVKGWGKLTWTNQNTAIKTIILVRSKTL